MNRRTRFIFFLFLIELVDELIGGSAQAVWPFIRTDLHLNYAQIGILLGVPPLVSNLIEPFLGILGDTVKRQRIVLAGGMVYAAGLFLTGISPDFFTLLLSFILFYPASGAFVSLSQATLMDTEPSRREKNMARWAFAGSTGVMLGPFLFNLFLLFRLSWRHLYLFFGIVSFVLLFLVRSFPVPPHLKRGGGNFLKNTADALKAVKKRAVLKWAVLLQFSDLMLDILAGFLALYLVDVARVSGFSASLGIAVWMGVGLLGDFLLIPLLDRVAGIRYLKWSALIEFILYPLFLLAPWFGVKLALLGLLGFFNSGWYSILQARLYTALPRKSGAVMAVNNFFGLGGALIPLGLGLIAQRWGLSVSMWFLLLGPVALIAGLFSPLKHGRA